MTILSEALIQTAAQLAAPGKGLLAADESTGTIGKRLENVGLTNTEEHRRAYREALLSGQSGDTVSGVILFKETLYQRTADGTLFVDLLRRQGVLPGIKADEGLEPLEGHPLETHTRGLDTLEANCSQWYKDGARFAKWRAVLKVGEGMPSEAALDINAKELAAYAVICQRVGLVPVVEPEVLIDGTHDLATFAEAAERVISRCVQELWHQGVLLEGMLLKPQMVLPGTAYTGPKPSSEEIATHTLRVLRRTLPPAVPGVMFLSGGQTEEEATLNLNALNLLAQAQGSAPWALSFSFGRALQASVLKIWSADQSAVAQASGMAGALAAANSAASRGLYEGPHPSVLGLGSLHELHRGWRTDVPGARSMPQLGGGDVAAAGTHAATAPA